MAKTKISFTVTGATKEVIERRAYSQIAEFLEIDVASVTSSCEIEFDINESTTDFEYTATVYVRVK